ncbi:MAG: hypothetical protein N3A71_02900 [Candidatus Dojkabacteria bacterium]|nr:hypothetical protein [Candidatus Dojkabacteria bacterium]
MNKIHYPKFDAKLTFLGGQTLTWEEEFYPDKTVFWGFYSKYIIQIKYDIKKEVLYWQTYPQQDRYDIIKKILRFDYYFEDHSKLEIDTLISETKNIIPSPIIVLEQEFLTTAVAFIISQNNNIKRIKKIITKVRHTLGQRIFIKNKEYHLFPTHNELVSLVNSNKIYEYGLGYRSSYLIDFISRYNNINTTDPVELEKQLLSVKGIGPKVCDCILVFSGVKKDTTPVDVWTKRGVKQLFNFETKNYKKMRYILSHRFKDVTYIAGQYIFEYARLAKLQ